jgi:transcriptional regulator of arginine metabolism
MRALKHHRQEAIRRVLRKRAIKTQEQLVELLRGEGFEVTQATLSRDLAELGVLRVSRPDGAVYELEPVAAQATPQQAELGESILSAGENDALVVIRTRPGMASALALAIDNARMPECLGTLAGDDTIFATPSRNTTTRRLAQQIRTLFGRELT